MAKQKVTISYKRFGGIETELDIPEGASASDVRAAAEAYLEACSDEELNANLDGDGDAVVLTSVDDAKGSSLWSRTGN